MLGPRRLQLSAEQAELLTPEFSADAVDQLTSSLTEHPPRLLAEVLSTKSVTAGAGVSYGHTYRTSAATTLALVVIGYGHGLPRKAGNSASVTWGSPARRMPIVGRVAMDVLVIDAGDAPVESGDEVVFFGDPERGEIPLREWSESVCEHPFSVLASLDHRVRREVSQRA